MAKQNNSKLIKVYEDSQFRTELWWNDETKQFDVWRNKKVVKTFAYKGYVLFEDMVNVAKIECDEWVNDTDHANLTLNEYLQRNNIKLTDIEIKSMNAIFGEGSFYEESGSGPDERGSSSFFGWYIDESEVPGCRGALSSLVKKGVIEIAYDDSYGDGPQAMYYINFKVEFLPETEGYHKLKIDEENRK